MFHQAWVIIMTSHMVQFFTFLRKEHHPIMHKVFNYIASQFRTTVKIQIFFRFVVDKALLYAELLLKLCLINVTGVILDTSFKCLLKPFVRDCLQKLLHLYKRITVTNNSPLKLSENLWFPDVFRESKS